MRHNIAFFLIFIALAVIAISALTLPVKTLALGISTPVLQDNIVGAAEGGNPVQFTITLQNVEENDVSVKITYSSDSDIVNIIDYRGVYVLPAKSLDTKITFNITLPKAAKVNDIYEVRYTVTPLTAQSGGIISLVPGISKSFKVKAVKNPDKFYFGYYLQETGKLWAVVILIVAAYVAYGAYKRKKAKHGKIW